MEQAETRGASFFWYGLTAFGWLALGWLAMPIIQLISSELLTTIMLALSFGLPLFLILLEIQDGLHENKNIAKAAAVVLAIIIFSIIRQFYL